MSSPFRIGLLREVFAAGRRELLAPALQRAADRDVDLVVLPELPLDRWAPAARETDPGDTELSHGPRHALLAGAARAAGVAVLGGAIVRDPDGGRRFNTALAYDAAGSLAASYRKVHLPQEAGFWEADHYDPGDEPPRVFTGLGPRLGIQICSDINRPSGTQLLAAAGVEVVLVPRATEPGTWERWRLVLRAAAITAAAFVVSVNRPHPEGGTDLGGPSIAIGPDGAVLAESEENLVVVALDLAAAAVCRRGYPGYLALPSGLYAAAWSRTGSGER